jgi:iron complex outermembrane receptor protein
MLAGAPARAGADPACTATLDIDVVSASSHEPVPGAIVRLSSGEAALTDEKGHAAFSGLCPGSIEIQVEASEHREIRQRLELAAAEQREIVLPGAAPAGEVIVIQERAPEPEAMGSTAVVDGKALARSRGRPLTEALAEVPGVAPLRTGSGVAKPVVRGQYGRRLQLVVDGVRHRAQDWGLDHAPELDPFVAARIKVVRGASGVRYGPDAIGGAVVVDPPEPRRRPGVRGELHAVGFSNGVGGSLASRLQGLFSELPSTSFQLEGSLRRSAASETPDYALDNTGAGEWALGATVAQRAGDDDYELSFRHYQARLGVCTCLRVDSAEDFRAQIERERPLGAESYTSELSVERPYPAVAHELAVARARWRWAGLGMLATTYSFQYDHRREYDIVRDATTGPQFDFRLATHDLDVVFEHVPLHVGDHAHLRGSVGVAGTLQVHDYAGLPLIPDYLGGAAAVHASERLVTRSVEVEGGARYDFLRRAASLARNDFSRLVRSGQLAEDSCGLFAETADSVDCATSFHTFSASLGARVELVTGWTAKLELATASRPPNPDEQYLNGTSPTFPVLGLGKPDLGAETSLSATLTTAFRGGSWIAEVSGFVNRIDDYIYFQPAIDDGGAPVFDVLIRGTFPRFVTRPVDALFYGVDGGVELLLPAGFSLGAQLSVVRAKNRSDGGYLVLIPPDRVRASAGWRRDDVFGLSQAFASVGATVQRRQTRYELSADFAPPPPGSVLVDLELGVRARFGHTPVELALRADNLLGTRHREYPSLLRYYADQPGRQIFLRLGLEFETSP